MRVKAGLAALCAAATMVVSAAVSVETLTGVVSTFDDIKYWVGEGTNKCAIVIDFNDTSVKDAKENVVPSSYVWGFRWNGEAPSYMEMLNRIAADDPKFTANILSSGWVNGFSYDYDGDGEADFAPTSWGDYDYSEYEDEEIEEPTLYYMGDNWAASHAASPNFVDCGWVKNENATAGMFPKNGEWFVQRFAPYVMEVLKDSWDWPYILDEFEPTVSPTATVPARLPSVSTFADVKTWYGYGSKSMVLVIDFNDGSVDACSFAWGYRWNGEAPTVETILNEIAEADPRLTVTISPSSYGGYLNQIAYDHDNNPNTPDLLGEVGAEYEQDAEFIYEAGTSWMLLAGEGSVYPRDEVATTPVGMSSYCPKDGEWICWRICTYWTTYTKDWVYEAYEGDTTSLYDPVVSHPVLNRVLPVPTVDSFTVGTDRVSLTVGNVRAGLFYGLKIATDPAGDFAEPTTWVRNENGTVVLEAAKTGTAGFYKVVVSDVAK